MPQNMKLLAATLVRKILQMKITNYNHRLT